MHNFISSINPSYIQATSFLFITFVFGIGIYKFSVAYSFLRSPKITQLKEWYNSTNKSKYRYFHYYLFDQKDKAFTEYESIKTSKNPNLFYPQTFLIDALHQAAVKYFEERYLSPISLISNLLPPLGFLGTVLGIMIVANVWGTGDDNIQISIAGVSIALISTFFALLYYFLLELFYSFLLKRSVSSIDDGLNIPIVAIKE